MGTKNVVIAMLCASIVILSIATPISAVKLENSGMSGEIDGTGVVTGSVSIEASTATDGTADVEASIEASVRLDGPGSAECSQEGPVTHTLETELGTIVADVSEDSKVEAAVEVVGEGKAQADAYVGTSANLGESEVEIVSEVSSSTYVETNGGSASATASATGTTTGDGTSYATGCAPNDATSHAEVSGDTEANVAVSGTAEAASYAAVGSTDYAGHYKVEEESYIEAGSYAGSEDGSTASADSSANGEAYQDGQAENCASSNTYVEGEVSSAVATEGLAGAMSGVYIWSYDNASKDTDEAYVYEESDIYAWSGAESDTDGKASAASSADGDTDAAGSACDCVYLDTSATGIVSSAVATEGLADAVSDTWIWSYGEAYKDTDEAYVEELSDIYAWSGAASDTDGKASADSSADGDTDAAGSACGCVYSDTSATGIVSSAVATEGLADAVSGVYIWSYGEAYKDTDEAYVYEESDIEAWSGAGSDTDGKASADSASIGYTNAAGSACGCVYSDTSATGIVSSAVQTEGLADAVSDTWIWSYGEAYNGTDGAYVEELSDIEAWSGAESDTDGGASADSASIGYTDAAGSACGCVYSDTSAIGIVSSAVQTEGNASAVSDAGIWSYDEAYNGTDGAYVYEGSEIYAWSEAGSDTDGGASADSASIGYTGAAGSACDCVYSDTSAIGIVSSAVQTQGPAGAWSGARIWSYDYAEKDTNGAYVEEESSIEGRSEAGSDTDGGASAESASIGYTGAAGSACDCVDSWTKAKGAVEVKTETDGDAWISAFARLTSEGWIDIGIQMGANSVINTSATAQHDSNSEGTATADGSTKAGASNSCTGERVETGILYGEGETVVNPFDVMNTNTYAGFAYANAIPSGFEDIDFDVYIDTTGPNEAFSFTDAIAIIPAPAITTTP